MATQREYKTVLTAEDKTAAAFRALQSNIDAAERSYQRLANTARVIASGGLVVGLVSMADSALKAADEMGDAAERAGMAVEKFSALAYAAKQSDVATADLETGIKKLSQAISFAAAGQEKYTKLFDGLGVKVRDANGSIRSTADVLSDLATAFKGVEDSPVKTAAGVELMGRNFTSLVPLLNKGGTEIHRLELEAAALGKTMDAETAAAADKFNKDLDRLKDNSAALARSLVQNVVPALDDVVKATEEALRTSGPLTAAWVALGGAGNMIFGDGLQTDLDRLGKLTDEMDRLSKQIAQMRKDGYQEDFLKPEIDRFNELSAAASRLEGQLRAAERIKQQRGGFGLDARDLRLRETPPPKKLDPVALGLGPDPAKKYAEDLEALYNRLDNTTATVNAKFWQELKMLDGEFEKGRTSVEQYRQRVEALINQTEYGKNVQKEALDAAKAANEEAQKAMDAADAQNAKKEDAARVLRQYTEALEFEAKTLGMTNGEREIEAQRLALEKAGFDTNTKSVQDYLERMREAQKQIDEYNNTLSTANDAADLIGSTLRNAAESGGHAFDSLIADAKRFGMQMLEIFARRYTLQMAASLVGGSAGTALAGQAAQVGQGTAAGAGANALSSGLSTLGSSLGIMGSTGLLSTLGGAIGGSFGAGLTFTGSAGLMEGAAAALSGTGTAAFSLGAIIPVIGWVLAVAAILYSIFGSKGGGTKSQGAFLGSFDTGGNLLQSLTGAEDVTNIHGTQDASNAQAQVIGQSIARGLVQSITSMGGHASALQVGAAFSMDPAGNAPSFFHGVLRDASGAEFFRYQNDNLSRDPQEFQTQVQNALSRMVVAALQHDNTIPEPIRRYVQTIDAATASDQDVQRVLQGAQAVRTLIEDTGHLKDALAELADPSGVQAVTDQLRAMAKTVADAGQAFDNALAGGDPQQILAAEQAYTQAVLGSLNQQIQMVRTLQQAIAAAKQQAYEFAVAMAQRINTVGGNVDIGALSLAHANDLKGQIGSGPIDLQAGALSNYVGAIDTWYNARRTAILAQMHAEDEAGRAIARAQEQAAQSRLAQLQTELDLAKQMQTLAERAGAMLSDLQLSTANPLPTTGRLALAQANVASLRAAYEAATGQDKVDLANKLLDALKTEQDLGAQAFQRPSPEWQAIYNELTSEISEVQKDAKSAADQSVDLQQQILDAQNVANQYAAEASAADRTQSADLDSLDTEARGYYTWAQQQGAAIFAQQEANARAQLLAITGGSDPELFIAQKQAEATDLLRSIDARLQKFLDTVGTDAGGSSASSGGGSSTGAGDSSGGSDGTTGGGSGGNPIARPSGATKTVHFTINVAKGEDPIDAIIRNKTRVKRALQGA